MYRDDYSPQTNPSGSSIIIIYRLITSDFRFFFHVEKGNSSKERLWQDDAAAKLILYVSPPKKI